MTNLQKLIQEENIKGSIKALKKKIVIFEGEQQRHLERLEIQGQ